MKKLIKHRGIKNEFIKENTYLALKNALEDDKYLGVEFDVRETLDKEFILHHDPICNGKLIKNTRYSDLPKYVPKLKDVLKIKSNKIFLVEIKNVDSYEKLKMLLNKFAYQKIYVMSFSNKIIDKLNDNSKSYKIGILNYVLNTSPNLPNLDFVVVLNNLLNDNIMKILKDKIIFSYGILNHNYNFPYEDVYYIVD